MIPMLSELGRFCRYLFTAETEIAAVQYESAAAGAAKAGLWTLMAIMGGVLLARLLA